MYDLRIYSILAELFKEQCVIDLIKGFSIDQLYAVSIITIQIVIKNVIEMVQQLSETAMTRAKSMLSVTEELIGFQVRD